MAGQLVSGRIAQSGVEFMIAPDLPTISANRSLKLKSSKIRSNSWAINVTRRSRSGRDWTGSAKYFYVRDKGVGIDLSCHERVFEQFNRLECKGVEGSGLGLALVKRAIEVQGGRIWVESEGPGQTFSLR